MTVLMCVRAKAFFSTQVWYVKTEYALFQLMKLTMQVSEHAYPVSFNTGVESVSTTMIRLIGPPDCVACHHTDVRFWPLTIGGRIGC
jgi:hypothetical protein